MGRKNKRKQPRKAVVTKKQDTTETGRQVEDTTTTQSDALQGTGQDHEDAMAPQKKATMAPEKSNTDPQDTLPEERCVAEQAEKGNNTETEKENTVTGTDDRQALEAVLSSCKDALKKLEKEKMGKSRHYVPFMIKLLQDLASTLPPEVIKDLTIEIDGLCLEKRKKKKELIKERKKLNRLSKPALNRDDGRGGHHVDHYQEDEFYDHDF